MTVMSIRDAINATLMAEMERDDSIILLGEDIVGGMGTAGGPEAIGGIWGATGGLWAKFGADRVIDTPISESAIVGAAAGAALAGKRPVAELMFADFVGVSLDQLWNQMAKFRYMFGGKTRCPAVIRLIYGAGMNAAAQHSQSVYAMMTAIPGLKIVLPATPADAKGLLTEALRGDDPVLFFEHKAMFGMKGDVPDGDYRVPFGQARLTREGGDVTIVTCGRMVGFAEKAADKLAADGIGCDVIDLRTTSRPVSSTLSKIASSSIGLVVRRSITSQPMPSAASLSAAFSANPTIRPQVTIVTSPPSRVSRAWPNGTR